MNPTYKFALSAVYNGTTNTIIARPLYNNSLSKDYERESNQGFYRAKLNGKLLFIGDDYTFINNARFETQFILVISISWNAGVAWSEYWRGEFYKTDCTVNRDNKSFEVTPTTLDGYTEVLAGMEKEYNLIDLKPAIEHVTIDKRPLIQVYIPGEASVSCFLSGMYWEQDCEVVDESETIEVEGQQVNKLTNYYHFAKCKTQLLYDVIGEVNIVLLGAASQGYTFSLYEESGPGGDFWRAELVRTADNATWYKNWSYGKPKPDGPYDLMPDISTAASMQVIVSERIITIYSRYLLDVESISGRSTYRVPIDDLVNNNRNYRCVIDYSIADAIAFSVNLSSSPTKWGIMQPGIYYDEPDLPINTKFHPIGRNSWTGAISIWFSLQGIDLTVEVEGRKEYTLRDSSPLASVISVLLGQIAPGITHEATAEYSEFLYSLFNPISGKVFELYITQKSNILAGEYTQPAQKAPITLKMITDMLRDCFCAYWYIEDNKFKIEHIKWFKNGGRYSGEPGISLNLTARQVLRNGKAWAYETSQYNYEKATMPERYQFSWDDDVTEAFEGRPVEIRSRFVQRGNIEETSVNNFNADVDYMLLNPQACSPDGFAILATVVHSTTGKRELSYSRRILDGITYINQNGFLAFINLIPDYHVFDMPSYDIRVNNVPVVAQGIQRKKKQEVRFPVKDDPNPLQLIRTFLGDGQIEKLSINLVNRGANATLAYNTYEYNE